MLGASLSSKFKRGVTTQVISGEQKSKYLNYKMVTDLFDFADLQKESNFGIKHFKDSHYMGQINPDKNSR